MDPELSIIIPCYNCEKTLEDAVASCYIQGLAIDFEIVLVDDGSSDGTKAVMKALSEKHPEIRLFYHDANRGGGAARNTAVRNSRAEIIYCLDSDNMLPPNALSKMYSFLREKNCDAVGINRSVKFKGTDVSDIAFVNTMGRAGERIPFESLVFETPEEMCPIYSTFMHTKKSFFTAGGYPEHHGFDTQGFAWRFLSNGLSAYTCPEAYDLHRVSFSRSYYIREYESGKINYNWVSVLEEFLYLFDDDVKRMILSYDFKDYTRTPFAMLQGIAEPFAPDYRDSIAPGGRNKRFEKLAALKRESLSAWDNYWLGNELLFRGDPDAAAGRIEYARDHGADFPITREKAEMAALCRSGMDLSAARKAVEAKRGYLSQGSLAPYWLRALRKLRRVLTRR
jgi:glycosyltransferase involved in cell wall biosynthesis